MHADQDVAVGVDLQQVPVHGVKDKASERKQMVGAHLSV